MARLPDKETVANLLLARLATDNKYAFGPQERRLLQRASHRFLFALCVETGNVDLYPQGTTFLMLSSQEATAEDDARNSPPPPEVTT
jgi:hypothetical protein